MNSDNITSWHPEFPLEDIDVPKPSDLPQPPVQNVSKSAKDIMGW